VLGFKLISVLVTNFKFGCLFYSLQNEYSLVELISFLYRFLILILEFLISLLLFASTLPFLMHHQF